MIRVDIVFVSTGCELTLDALKVQHQSLSLICRALSHLATSAIKKNKVSIVEVFFFVSYAVLRIDIMHVLKHGLIVHICILI